jgi:hypothetical protein
MNGGIIFCIGSLIGWIVEHQDCMSLSSCEAKIHATSATSKKVVDFINLCHSVSKSGLPLLDATLPTILYNDNDACVKWSYNTTSKMACHVKLCENLVREWVQDKSLKVLYVAGKTNPADIFTKELQDGTHFWRLRDSFMSRLSNFLSVSVLAVHHAWQCSPTSVAPAAAQVCLSTDDTPFLQVLPSSVFFRTVSNISHLLSADWQLLWCIHGFVPSSDLKDDPWVCILGILSHFSFCFSFCCYARMGV